MQTTKNGKSTASTVPDVVQIPTEEIKFFVRRSRPTGGYTRLKESIKEVGLRQPIHVREIRAWKTSDRKRPDGGLYNYELVCGQGRLQAFRELEIPSIPALVLDVPEHEIVGRFLAENVIRKRLSWHERAQLVKKDFENGLEIEEVKRKYFITAGHVYKYLRTLRQASAKLIATCELEKMSMNDAEALTALSPEDQDVIVEFLKEENLATHQVLPLVKKAKEIKQNGEFSKDALRNSLRGLAEQLKEARNTLKIKRLHWSLGPKNLNTLLRDPEFRVQLEKQGVEFETYLRSLSMEAL